MFELTVGIIGKISVGKSSVANVLSEKTSFPIVSFGAYLVKHSKLMGLPTDRKALQDLGEKLIREDTEAFLQNVIMEVPLATERIILEGIRHAAILKGIRNISRRSFVVYLEATSETRFSRYCKRIKDSDTKLNFEEFVQKDNHVVEAEVESLRSSCDLIINSNQLNVSQTVDAIIELLRQNV